MNITKVKNNYTIKGTDSLVVCDSGSAISLYLNSASGSGDLYYIKNIGAGEVTVTANLPDLIDGDSTKTVVQYESCLLLDYETNVWIVV